MSEIPREPDPQFAATLRYAGEFDGTVQKTAFDPTELDHIVDSVQFVAENTETIPRHFREAVSSGRIIAGFNKTGEAKKTELTTVSPEEFRAIIERAIGTTALHEYEQALQAFSEPGGSSELPADIQDIAAFNPYSTPEHNALEQNQEPRNTAPQPEQEDQGENAQESFEVTAEDEHSTAESATRDVLAEVSQQLGLPEGLSREQLGQRLTVELEKVKGMVHAARGIEDFSHGLNRKIHESLSESRNILGDQGIHEIRSMVESRDFRSLQSYLRGNEGLIPVNLRQRIDKGASVFDNIARMAEHVSQRPGFVDFDALNRLRVHFNQLEEVSGGLVAVQCSLEDMRTQLAVDINEGTKDQETPRFRNEQVVAWATELSAQPSAERVKQIEEAMESAVRIEAEMHDDPTSPAVWFADQIKYNREKSRREGTQYSGRADATIGSQQHVAELMSDMLRGHFNIAGGNSSSIEVQASHNARERVRLGKHRAAALAMLYGADWQAQAQKMGITVKTI